MKIVENKSFDEERAFYGSHELMVRHCAFDGPADGESAFKECGNISAEECFFNLRYPFWHVHRLKIAGSEMTELCRAASRFFSEQVYERAKEPKELYVVEDAEHIDLYDRTDRIPFDKMESFLKENLK